MATAATGSVDMAEQVATATGREMKLAGINWAYRFVFSTKMTCHHVSIISYKMSARSQMSTLTLETQ